MAKILMITDVPNWIFDRNAWLLKKYIPYHDFDVCYANSVVKNGRFWRRDWDLLEKSRHYDVVWMFHPGFLTHMQKQRFDYAPIDGQQMEHYVNWHNERGTQIILDINHLFTDNKSDQKIAKMLTQGNFLTVNNPQTKKYFEELGLQAHYTPNGWPEETFKVTTPFKERAFQVLWCGSEKRKEHKGWHIFQEVRKAFKGIPGIKFKEVMANSFDYDNVPFTQEQMNKIYNQCQVYVCLSESEGGPNPMLESAAVGCVPICTDVGYAKQLIEEGESGFVIPREADACIKKINFLRTNPEALQMMSAAVSERVKEFGWIPLHENFARLINKAVAKKADYESKIKLFYRPRMKILAVADTKDWVLDRKLKTLQERVTTHDIEIAYTSNWQEVMDGKPLKENHDMVWFLHMNPKISIQKFADQMNREGRKVIATITHLMNYQGIEKMLPHLQSLHALSSNNPQCWHRLKKYGLDAWYTPDGTRDDIFRYENPIEKRDFKVLWVGSRQHMNHKGHRLFMELKEKLANQAIGFVDVVGDRENNQLSAEEMNKIYNDAVIYCCMSNSEGGPAPLLESMQCGCVPISTNVGYASDLNNIYVVEREVDVFAEKIMFLKENRDVLYRMSHGIREEAEKWTWDVRYKKYQDFLDHASRIIS